VNWCYSVSIAAGFVTV